VPQNVTLHGRLFEEGKILAIGQLLENASGACRNRPPGTDL